MNKTIADAYKALKGDLNNTEWYMQDEDACLFFDERDNRWVTFINQFHKPEYFKYICTVEEFNNYKGDEMKTTMDAVIEFKGDFPDALVDYDGWAYAWFQGEIVNAFNFKGDAVCTYEEFNTLVDELSSNFGRSITYDEYKQECKESFSAVEDKISCKVCLVGNFTSQDYCQQCGNELHEQSQPIFTQAMADAGELPSVGVECMILFDQDSEPKWEKITWYGVFNGSPAFSFNGKNCWPERGGEFHLKPVDQRTDKEKAIDYMKYAYAKGESMEDVFTEITKGYVHGVTWSGNNE